jgi:hypothetical protein
MELTEIRCLETLGAIALRDAEGLPFPKPLETARFRNLVRPEKCERSR